jgi:hypothetical protein
MSEAVETAAALTRPSGRSMVTIDGADTQGGRPVRRSEHGMVSAEWAVGLIAAIAVAGVLLAVVTNGAVKSGLLKFILTVIHAFSDGL